MDSLCGRLNIYICETRCKHLLASVDISLSTSSLFFLFKREGCKDAVRRSLPGYLPLNFIFPPFMCNFTLGKHSLQQDEDDLRASARRKCKNKIKVLHTLNGPYDCISDSLRRLSFLFIRFLPFLIFLCLLFLLHIFSSPFHLHLPLRTPISIELYQLEG